MVVGLSSVRGIALGVAMDSLYEDHPELDSGHWERAVVSAGGAVAMAENTGADRGEAFSAGLMIDIGQIAMAVHRPDFWARTLEETTSNTSERFALELELFAIDHAQLGSEILVDFGLLPALTLAVSAHHRPLVEIDTALGRCVAVAGVISELAQLDMGAIAELEARLPDLGFSAAALLTQTIEQVEGLRSVFVR